MNGTFDQFKNQLKVVGSCTLPYCGEVRLQYEFTAGILKPHVYVQGNGIDGDIAATKRLINARSFFLLKPSLFTAHGGSSYITDYDSLGIGVADHLHNAAAQATTYQNSTAFIETVKKILYDNNYETSIMTVETLANTSYHNSTILRIKHVSTDFSPDYQSVVNPDATRPIVFSGGLFSDLQTWETVSHGLYTSYDGAARQLANSGHDVWEIEMTGGPYTDCAGFANDSCPNYNYNYSDLVDYYWPASIAGVLKYSGKTQVDYVGHSNGGRVALSALNKYSTNGLSPSGYYFDYSTGSYLTDDLPGTPVNRFIGVAVPAVVNGPSVLTQFARAQSCFPVLDTSGDTIVNFSCTNSTNADTAMSAVRAKNLVHLNMKDYLGPVKNTSAANTYVELTYISASNNTISSNLMQFYSDLANSSSTAINLSSLNVTALYLINTNPEDVIVPFDDQNTILNGTTAVVTNEVDPISWTKKRPFLDGAAG